MFARNGAKTIHGNALPVWGNPDRVRMTIRGEELVPIEGTNMTGGIPLWSSFWNEEMAPSQVLAWLGNRLWESTVLSPEEKHLFFEALRSQIPRDVGDAIKTCLEGEVHGVVSGPFGTQVLPRCAAAIWVAG